MPTIAREGATARYRHLHLSDLVADAVFIFSGAGSEERNHIPVWDEALAQHPTRCVEIVDQQERVFAVRVNGTTRNLGLTDETSIGALFQGTAGYIDITGLSHPVWAALLRAALLTLPVVNVIYVEPAVYQAHQSPSIASLFDLTSRFAGLRPLPGFAKLGLIDRDTEQLFVAFLGFEGRRPRHLAMTLDPVPRVIPVIGLPGFAHDYGQICIASNQEFISENSAFAEIRYARASCPFEAYSVLEELRRDHPGSFMYLAPVGTKPHSVGAIWYAIEHPNDTELMYDHPVRKPGRTRGVGMSHVYRLKPNDVV